MLIKINQRSVIVKKLVRDKYADIIEQNDNVKLSICPVNMRKQMTVEKLNEEVSELIEAIDNANNCTVYDNKTRKQDSPLQMNERKKLTENIADELADVYEICQQIARLYEIEHQFTQSIGRKLTKFGSFSNYIVLEKNEQ